MLVDVGGSWNGAKNIDETIDLITVGWAMATYDYLVNLRTGMGEYIEAGGEIFNSTSIDQPAFSYLANFEAFAGKNAQRTFEQMEWK